MRSRSDFRSGLDRRIGVLCAVAATALVLAAPASAGNRVLWVGHALTDSPTETSSISTVSTAGGDSRDLITAAAGSGIGSAVIDVAHGRMYWTQYTVASPSVGSLRTATLDGSGATTVAAPGAEMTNLFVGAMAIDGSRGRVYWLNSPGPGLADVWYANTDGSGAGTLYRIGTTLVTGLVSDPARGMLWWSRGDLMRLQFAPIGGGGPVTDVPLSCTAGGDVLHAFALDHAGGRLYWVVSRGSSQVLIRTALDGTGCSTLGSTDSGFPDSLAIDSSGTRAYFAQDQIKLDPTEPAIGSWSLAAPYAFAWLAGPWPDPSNYDSNNAGAMLLEVPQVVTQTSLAPASSAIGETLTCTMAAFAGDVNGLSLYRAAESTAIAWQRDGVVIAGATSATYTPSSDGSYACVTSATNAAGATESVSAAVVVPKPVSSAPRLPASPRPRLARAPRVVVSGSSVVLSSSVQVTSAGTLSQSAVYSSSVRAAKAVSACAARVKVKKAGTVKIACRLNAKARAALRKGALKLTLTTTFTAAGKAPTSVKSTVSVPRASGAGKARASHGLLR